MLSGINVEIRIWLLLGAGFLLYSMLATIVRVGKAREPLTGNDAAATALVLIAIIVAMVLAAIQV